MTTLGIVFLIMIILGPFIGSGIVWLGMKLKTKDTNVSFVSSSGIFSIQKYGLELQLTCPIFRWWLNANTVYTKALTAIRITWGKDWCFGVEVLGFGIGIGTIEMTR